jgi:hypothetical protein
VKRDSAMEVLRRVAGAGSAALPAQVLSEFANACLRKLEPRPDPAAVRREVERLLLAFPVLRRPCGVFGSTCSHTTTPKSGLSPAWGRWPWS